MDLKSVTEAALQLGIIPTVALLLILRLSAQNRRLTDMVDRQEQIMQGLIQKVVTRMISDRGRGAQVNRKRPPEVGDAS